tara:strand:+ start:286 stop:825 length:540 start_codon:yes stop_codon:yes gene_type:complete
MFYDKELVRRGVIVPVFKNKQSNNLTFNYKGKYYLNYLKARSKARSLNLGSAAEWKKYCYLHTQLPQGLPESPEIVYRNNGWKNFSDWLGVKIIKNTKKKRKKRKVIAKVKIFKSKPLNSVKNYKFSKLVSKRLPRAKNAIKLVGNLSRRSSYEYTDAEAQSIIKSLSKAMRNLRKKFR